MIFKHPFFSRDGFAGVFVRMAFLVGLFGMVGVIVNWLRPQPIEWVAQTPYQILVPCPEGLGQVDELAADDELLQQDDALWLDARSKVEFEQWHHPKAMNVPFDYLEATDKKTVQYIAGSPAHRIIIYGDGRDPDSGKELGRELSGQGIRNVFYVKGGAAALQEKGTGGIKAN